MSSIKEKTVAAFSTSTLAPADSYLMPVDRIAAVASAPDIGRKLWRALDYDAGSLREAIRLLAGRVKGKYRKESMEDCTRAAQQAVQEVMMPWCTRCGGSKEVMRGDCRTLCPDCKGVGVRRYSDYDRAQSLGLKLDDYRAGQWPEMIGFARLLVDVQEFKTNRIVRQKSR